MKLKNECLKQVIEALEKQFAKEGKDINAIKQAFGLSSPVGSEVADSLSRSIFPVVRQSILELSKESKDFKKLNSVDRSKAVAERSVEIIQNAVQAQRVSAMDTTTKMLDHLNNILKDYNGGKAPVDYLAKKVIGIQNIDSVEALKHGNLKSYNNIAEPIFSYIYESNTKRIGNFESQEKIAKLLKVAENEQLLSTIEPDSVKASKLSKAVEAYKKLHESGSELLKESGHGTLEIKHFAGFDIDSNKLKNEGDIKKAIDNVMPLLDRTKYPQADSDVREILSQIFITKISNNAREKSVRPSMFLDTGKKLFFADADSYMKAIAYLGDEKSFTDSLFKQIDNLATEQAYRSVFGVKHSDSLNLIETFAKRVEAAKSGTVNSAFWKFYDMRKNVVDGLFSKTPENKISSAIELYRSARTTAMFLSSGLRSVFADSYLQLVPAFTRGYELNNSIIGGFGEAASQAINSIELAARAIKANWSGKDLEIVKDFIRHHHMSGKMFTAMYGQKLGGYADKINGGLKVMLEKTGIQTFDTAFQSSSMINSAAILKRVIDASSDLTDISKKTKISVESLKVLKDLKGEELGLLVFDSKVVNESHIDSIDNKTLARKVKSEYNAYLIREAQLASPIVDSNSAFLASQNKYFGNGIIGTLLTSAQRSALTAILTPLSVMQAHSARISSLGNIQGKAMYSISYMATAMFGAYVYSMIKSIFDGEDKKEKTNIERVAALFSESNIVGPFASRFSNPNLTVDQKLISTLGGPLAQDFIGITKAAGAGLQGDYQKAGHYAIGVGSDILSPNLPILKQVYNKMVNELEFLFGTNDGRFRLQNEGFLGANQ